jgi:tetratricopeptide (TPR) repeat protein
LALFLILIDEHIFSLEIIDQYSQLNDCSIEITLLKAYLEDYNYNRINKLTLQKIETIIHDTPNNEYTKYFYHLLGLHFDFNDNKEKAIDYYRKSIEHDPTASSNYFCLGLVLNSADYIKLSIENVQLIEESKVNDHFSFNDFINDSIRGVSKFQSSIDDMKVMNLKMKYKVSAINSFLKKIKNWLRFD